MYMKAKDLLAEVYKVVGLIVAGTGVQKYSEPQAYAGIQLAFDMVFKKRFWDHLTDWHTVVINGVDGLITTDLTDILRDYTDIEKIVYSDNSRNVVKPDGSLDYRRVTGSDAQYWTPIKFNPSDPSEFITKVIKFWPVTSTSSVDIRCRTKPVPFKPDDWVPFDSAVMANGAAWQMLDSDGINPTAASKAQQMFDLLYIDLIAAEGEGDIGHGGGYTNVPLSIRTL